MLILDKSAGLRKVNADMLYADALISPFTADFTVELFDVVWSATTDGILISHYNATGNQRSWRIDYVSGVLNFIGSTNGTATVTLSHTFTPTIGQPYQVAADRSGTTARLYLDGSQVDSDTLSGALHNTTANLTIGSLNGTFVFPGSAKAVRITNGTARYAGGYTPPTLPLPTS